MADPALNRRLRVGTHQPCNIYLATTPPGVGGDEGQVGYIRLGWLAQVMVDAYNASLVRPTGDALYQVLVAREAAGRAEHEAEMWRARWEAVTDVPGAVQQLVDENDRLRTQVEGNRDTISSLLRDGADVWRDISESLVKGGRWVWEYAHADHEGFDPSREDTEWTTDRPGSDCGAKGCVRRRHWIGPPEPTTSREARTEEADRV